MCRKTSLENITYFDIMRIQCTVVKWNVFGRNYFISLKHVFNYPISEINLFMHLSISTLIWNIAVTHNWYLVDILIIHKCPKEHVVHLSISVCNNISMLNMHLYNYELCVTSCSKLLVSEHVDEMKRCATSTQAKRSIEDIHIRFETFKSGETIWNKKLPSILLLTQSTEVDQNCLFYSRLLRGTIYDARRWRMAAFASVSPTSVAI